MKRSANDSRMEAAIRCAKIIAHLAAGGFKTPIKVTEVGKRIFCLSYSTGANFLEAIEEKMPELGMPDLMWSWHKFGAMCVNLEIKGKRTLEQVKRLQELVPDVNLKVAIMLLESGMKETPKPKPESIKLIKEDVKQTPDTKEKVKEEKEVKVSIVPQPEEILIPVMVKRSGVEEFLELIYGYANIADPELKELQEAIVAFNTAMKDFKGKKSIINNQA